MASELGPRLQLAVILRILIAFFGVYALINIHAYIGSVYNLNKILGPIVLAWLIIAWNALCTTLAALHPYLQRLADGLPFPIKVSVRNRVILSYGDSDEGGDGFFAPLTGKLVLSFVDLVLATLLLVFALAAEHECCGRKEGFRVQEWILSIWWTLVTFQYVIALIQSLEALSIWYQRRYVKNRGNISLA